MLLLAYMTKITESKEFEGLVNKSYKYKFSGVSWSDWGLLFRFLIVICRLLDNDSKKPKKKRKVSAWSQFLGEKLREGKTIQEAAALWKNKPNH